MVLNRFSGWLDYPEYYFFWNFHGNNSIFNISAYKNPAMDKLIDLARFTEDKAEYEKAVKEFVALCIAGGADRAAQPADPRRGDAEGGRRLRVLVPPRARLPAVPQGLSGLHGAAVRPSAGPHRGSPPFGGFDAASLRLTPRGSVPNTSR